MATPEGKAILGAALIGDVMGLFVLATMAGLAGGGAAARAKATAPAGSPWGWGGPRAARWG